MERKDQGLYQVHADPFLDRIKSDPRWLPFLRKVGKAPEQLAQIEFDVKIPPTIDDAAAREAQPAKP